MLLRGADVVGGHELVRTRRGPRVGEGSFADGPGKLCQALGVTRDQNGQDLCDPNSPLHICDDGFRVSDSLCSRTPRIGVEYAGEAASWPLRYVIDSRV